MSWYPFSSLTCSSESINDPVLSFESSLACCGLVSALMDHRLGIFYRQYLQQVNVKRLSFPPDNVLIEPMIQYQMNRYLFDSHLMFPSELGSGVRLPSLSYRKRVAKELMKRIEGAIRDPNEDVGYFFFVPFLSLLMKLTSDVLDAIGAMSFELSSRHIGSLQRLIFPRRSRMN